MKIPPEHDGTYMACLARQFDRMWTGLRQAILIPDDKQWRTGSLPFLIPAGLAYHIIETADFYAGESSVHFTWGALGGDWDNTDPSRWPSQERMNQYLEQVRLKLVNWLAGETDDTLLQAQEDFQWTGPTVLDRALYSLRHSQHHLGQINAEYRHRGLPRAEWA